MGETKKIKIDEILEREVFQEDIQVPDFSGGVIAGSHKTTVNRVRLTFKDYKFGIVYKGIFSSTEEPGLGDIIEVIKPHPFSNIRNTSFVIDDRGNRFDLFRGRLPEKTGIFQER